MALGADTCNSARAMMMALGCIQALRCNTNDCPTGVATQNPALTKGLVVEDKKKRVANFHRHTVESFVELMGASGIDDLKKINRAHIYRRVQMDQIKSFEEIFPTFEENLFFNETRIPADYQYHIGHASAEEFSVL
jgi:hypothetical protein